MGSLLLTGIRCTTDFISSGIWGSVNYHFFYLMIVYIENISGVISMIKLRLTLARNRKRRRKCQMKTKATISLGWGPLAGGQGVCLMLENLPREKEKPPVV